MQAIGAHDQGAICDRVNDGGHVLWEEGGAQWPFVWQLVDELAKRTWKCLPWHVAWCMSFQDNAISCIVTAVNCCMLHVLGCICRRAYLKERNSRPCCGHSYRSSAPFPCAPLPVENVCGGCRAEPFLVLMWFLDPCAQLLMQGSV